MAEIFIQVPPEGVPRDLIEFAAAQGHGVEITAFALPWILDSNWHSLVRLYKEALKGFPEEIAVHGVFLDMITSSRDERIAAVCRERLRQNLEIASELGASILTVCSCFNPLIATSAPSYFEGYVARQADFWQPFAEQAKERDLLLVYENLWEPTPEPVRAVLDHVRSLHFRALLDTGHVNLFSKALLGDWVKALNEQLSYVHLNDNRGDADSELVPGKGTIDWKGFFEALGKYGLHPRLCLEVLGSGEAPLHLHRRALEHLRANRFYPYSQSRRGSRRRGVQQAGIDLPHKRSYN